MVMIKKGSTTVLKIKQDDLFISLECQTAAALRCINNKIGFYLESKIILKTMAFESSKSKGWKGLSIILKNGAAG